MELKLLRRGERICYAPDALIYDEKTQEGGNFQNQRKRWLGAQFLFLKAHFKPALRARLREENVDYFDKMLQMMLFPRLLLLGSLLA
jgi:cellulose synthase/poly-beta-1,6-N-acetylglucosamine synthase-like glycosyltransferase